MRGLFCVILGLATAGALCQAPEFLQQYRQRLDGAIGILHQQADAFDANARALSLTRAQALDRLKTNPDAVAASEGIQRQAAFDRLDTLARDRAALEQPDAIDRFAALIRHLDAPIARSTLNDFVPAVPFDAQGLTFAGLGFLIGLAVGGGLVGGAGLLARSTGRIRYRSKQAHRLRF
jgi:hypothetical protein